MQYWIVPLIIVAVALIIMAILYFVGNKLQKKQLAQKEQLNASAQPMTMFIISKKRLKLKDAGLPKAVMDQTKKRMHNTKMPVIKAKVGPQIVNLLCDDTIFDSLPIKGEVKAMVSGIYIVSVKNIRGKVEETPKKKGFRAKMRDKQVAYQDTFAQEQKEKNAKKAAKEASKAKKSTTKK